MKEKTETVLEKVDTRTADLHCHISAVHKKWLTATSRKLHQPIGALVNAIIGIYRQKTGE